MTPLLFFVLAAVSSAVQGGSTYTGGAQRGQRQRGPRVIASATKGILKVGERSAIRITVENTNDARIRRIPTVEGLRFDAPGRPSTNSSRQWVNGRFSSSYTMTWTVFFRVEKEGDFNVPSFVLEVEGQRVETRPINIRAVKDARGEDLGYLEIRPSSKRVVEGQPFTLELVFGWDQETEVSYANLILPWWGELPGTLELEQAPLPKKTPKLEGVTINGEFKTTVERRPNTARNGRNYTQLRLTRSFLPTRSGILEIPTSHLEFGRETKSFSLFDRPKRQGYYAQADPFTVEVISLPIEGQPFDFSGAVGTFNVRAWTDTRDVVVGDSIKLAVEWTGAGNLEFFEAPDASLSDEFRGFRIYGRTEEKSFERRLVTYDIAPLSEDVTEIPGLEMSVFDPVEEVYATIRSEPIPIRVRPLAKRADLGEEDSERFERDIHDIESLPSTPDREPLSVPGDGAVFATMAAVPLLWLGVRTGVRRRRGDPSAPRERRRRRARRVLAKELRRATDAGARLGALQGFLAARTGESPEAWVGRDPLLWARGPSPEDERFHELSPEAFEGAREIMNALEQETWGGGGEGPQPEDVLRTADALMEAGL